MSKGIMILLLYWKITILVLSLGRNSLIAIIDSTYIKNLSTIMSTLWDLALWNAHGEESSMVSSHYCFNCHVNKQNLQFWITFQFLEVVVPLISNWTHLCSLMLMLMATCNALDKSQYPLNPIQNTLFHEGLHDNMGNCPH